MNALLLFQKPASLLSNMWDALLGFPFFLFFFLRRNACIPQNSRKSIICLSSLQESMIRHVPTSANIVLLRSSTRVMAYDDPSIFRPTYVSSHVFLISGSEQDTRTAMWLPV